MRRPVSTSISLCHCRSQGASSSRPAVGFLALDVPIGESAGAGEMIVAGPQDGQARVRVASAVREGYEALLRHVEAAAQTPEILRLEVGGLIFRRHGNVADLVLPAALGLRGDGPVG